MNCFRSTAALAFLGNAVRWLVAAALLWVNVVGAVHAESLFTNQTPVQSNVSDGIPYELGMKFQLSSAGQITAVRYWKAASDTGSHVGRIWSSSGVLLASVTFAGESASGWQQQALSTALNVQVGTTYVVSVNVASFFPLTNAGLASSVANGNISSLADGNNGVYGNASAFPNGSYQSSNYFRDVVFVAATVGAPAKLALTPTNTTTQTGTAVNYTATIQDANGNPVTTATNPITFSVSGVSGTFTPSSAVTPTNGAAASNLTPTAAGTATITASANGLTSATATLVVSTPSTSAPQSLFTTQTPAVASASDGVPYELGMKFRAARSGTITAVRYWKAASDNGTHVGRIWSATGTLLASVSFAGESASGWQQQALSSPLAVQVNSIYVVSVNIVSRYPFTAGGLITSVVNGDLSSIADGNNGVYGNAFAFPNSSFQNANYFRDVVFVGADAGPAAQLTLIPGTANTQTGAAVTYTATIRDANGNTATTATNPITFSVSGVSGSFNPGSTEAPITPVSGNATTSFTATTSGSATITASSQGLGGATANLTVALAPAAATRVTLTPAVSTTQTGIAVTYTATIQDANGVTVTTATNPITLSVSGVAGAFSPVSPVAASSGVAMSNLTPTTAGTATIVASATGLASDAATLNVTGAATTAPQSLLASQTPTSPNASDGVPYELGMKFQVARPGRITAIRYWKAAGDTGTHIGRIWSSTGAGLGSATFGSETASGWQQQALSTPLIVQANTTYVVSVNVASNYAFTDGGLATAIVNGDVRSVADGNNGVYGTAFAFPGSSYHSSNYFRDIVFLADAVSSIAKVSGDKQSGTASVPLPNPLVVVVRDANNNPNPNVSVTFSITSGSGSISPTTAVTNSSGQASTTLTLGASGRTTVTATAAGIGSVTFQASVPNAVFLENQQPGTTAWAITNPVTETAPEIAGYAGATSVNKGGTLPFKITVAKPGQYSIAVYRLGHYAGTGGRLMGSFGPFAGVTQSACAITDPATRLVECKWATSFTLPVGSTWTSGLYTANLTALSSGKQSQIWFVVRDDSSTAELLFQSSFNTFVAYNNYGDSERHSLYEYNSTNGQRAYKVSLDRPFGQATEDQSNNNNINRYERNMARWLESQSYDVSYVSTLDVHLNPSMLFQHKTYLSVGHDEYWSLEMRNGVEAARDGGVNLGFFSANTAYWRVRFEPSSSGVPNRVMVCYKDPLVGDPIAPTYLWRGAQNNRPENALLGVMYVGDNDSSGGFDYVVSNAADPYYLNTGLTNNTALSQLVGYEWDAVVNNGFTPPGLVVLSSSTVDPTSIAPGLPTGTSTTTSNAARYTASGGAKVFATGSIQFAWGLNSDGISPPREDPRIKQFAINVLKDLGATPLTPDDGMIVP